MRRGGTPRTRNEKEAQVQRAANGPSKQNSLFMRPDAARAALRSILRSARGLPLPVRRKLTANVRALAESSSSGDAADAASAARLLRWVAGLSKQPRSAIFKNFE